MKDNSRYVVRSTSRYSAAISDVLLRPEDELAEATTRRIVRSEVVRNTRNHSAPVKITLMHQKKHSRSGDWQDADSFSLAQLRSGQEVRLILDTAQTLRLYYTLCDLYQIGREGVPQGTRNLRVIDEDLELILSGKEREAILYFREQSGDRFLEALEELMPDLLEAAALKRLHQSRTDALARFRERMAENEWGESEWQQFFESNTWIFGYGLAYRFLSTLQEQPFYGGTTLDGAGGQRGDFLLATEANARFTVLVDIKKPGTKLLHDRPYRNKVYAASLAVVSGVSQLQSNCRTWAEEGSRQDSNREQLRRSGTYTCEPKGILVVGHTEQLDIADKAHSFELFRRNLHNPEIITFDELLARAEFIVSHHEDA
ncbi:MAG: DUF4263 domain-containing protein [Chloroflexi bacterium]|nr:DUF4263 domain-containing protein [Chloroflexota bacterium]